MVRLGPSAAVFTGLPSLKEALVEPLRTAAAAGSRPSSHCEDSACSSEELSTNLIQNFIEPFYWHLSTQMSEHMLSLVAMMSVLEEAVSWTVHTGRGNASLHSILTLAVFLQHQQ